MLQHGILSHDLHGKGLAERLREGYITYRRAGEIIARVMSCGGCHNFHEVCERTIRGWMGSDGHRQLIFGDFTHCAPVVACDEDYVYVTVDFLHL